MIKKIIPIAISLFLSNNIIFASDVIKQRYYAEEKYITNVEFFCNLWDDLEKKIRDEEILPNNAKKKLNFILPSLKSHLVNTYGVDIFIEKNFAFPIIGSNILNVGGSNGSGYNPKGFDFFKGRKSNGHPTHDIFVRDKNYDCFDDKTKKEFYAVSVMPSLVLSTFDQWKLELDLRGGNYVWLYNPLEDLLFYYAHLNSIFVKKGEFIQKNQVIGTVGRTGKNAFPIRSPTHLHLMALKYKDNILQPYDFFDRLPK